MNDVIYRKEAIEALDPKNPRDWYTPWIIETLEELPSAELEYPTDVEEVLDYLDNVLHPILSPENWNVYSELHDMVAKMPAAQPEIIRCKDCKHWTQSVGKMKCYGLGRCDFHDADLVAYNGFCYWAERRTNE